MRLIAISLALGACAASEEATTVELPVTVAPAMDSATTDLGYRVQLTRMRIAVAQIEFTTEGEMHDAAVYRTANPVGTRPTIAKHPGHAGGGEVTGELPGEFILEWNGAPQPAFGTSVMFVGNYTGANFAIRNAATTDAMVADDPLLGHSFHLTGTVTRDGVTRDFDAVLDVESDTRVIGAKFDDAITSASTETLAIQFLPTDPYELDTAFDGIDFFALSPQIRPGDAAHNILRRAIQTHDHYGVTTL